MRRDSSGELFSIAAHSLKFLCTLHKKIEIMCITPQHRKTGEMDRLPNDLGIHWWLNLRIVIALFQSALKV
jgi:hypothetical protein